MKYERSVNAQRGLVVSFPPALNLLSGRKQNKVKSKQKYQDLTIRVLLLFIFRFFTPGPICRLPFVFSLFSKEERVNKKEKLKRKTPGNNVFTRKIQPKDQYKQTVNCLCSCPLAVTDSNSVAAPKPEKEQRTRQKKACLKI